MVQEYIALDVNNIGIVFNSGNIVSISGNIFLNPTQGHPILYNSCQTSSLENIIDDIFWFSTVFDLTKYMIGNRVCVGYTCYILITIILTKRLNYRCALHVMRQRTFIP